MVYCWQMVTRNIVVVILSCFTKIKPDFNNLVRTHILHSSDLLIFQLSDGWSIGDGGCVTECNGLGCHCSDELSSDTITIISHSNDIRHCLCGQLQVPTLYHFTPAGPRSPNVCPYVCLCVTLATTALLLTT